MSSSRPPLCELLEPRALLSVTPTVEADLLAVRAARATLIADHNADVATIHADNAAIPAAVANIAASITREESALHVRLQNDLNRIATDEHEGPALIAIDTKAVNKAEAILRVAESRNNTAQIQADEQTLNTAQENLNNERTRAAETLANDKAALVTFKQSEGAEVLTTKTNAIAAVQAAKAKFLADQQQSTTTWTTDSQALAAALAKLRADAHAGL